MAHQITADNRFAERSRSGVAPAWHGLGQKVPGDFAGSVRDMFALAGADISIVKVPEMGLVNGTPVETGKFLLYREDQTFKGETLPGGFVPESTPVSESYAVIDNMAIADMLDPLNKEWPIETVGLLKDGSVLFASMFGGSFNVKGTDENELYFLVTDAKNGMRSLRIDTTVVRAVCANTVALALAKASISVKIEHSHGAAEEFAFWRQAVPQLVRAKQEVKNTMEMLANTVATPANLEQIFAAAFPFPGKSQIAQAAADGGLTLSEEAKILVGKHNDQSDYHSGRIHGIHQEAHEQYDLFNQQHKTMARTLYAAAQSANYISCHRSGHSGSKDESVSFGARASESKRAFGAAVKIALARGKTISI